MEGAVNPPPYREYHTLPDAAPWQDTALPCGDYTLAKQHAFVEYLPKDSLRAKLQAVGDCPEVYGRSWKVHIGLVDVHKDSITTPQEKEAAIATIEKAWELIRPIITRYRVGAKVMRPDTVGDERWDEERGKHHIQSKKNIVLYYATLNDTPPRWHAMMQEIEQALAEHELPHVSAIAGSVPVKGSKYLRYSSSVGADEVGRVEPDDRGKKFLSDSPFENIDLTQPPPEQQRPRGGGRSI